MRMLRVVYEWFEHRRRHQRLVGDDRFDAVEARTTT